jgi:NAD(P)-dependent dehydrogenase (short-subunit alcohol dehydrogenase family)
MPKLTDKVALVTGGSLGIGLAAARRLAQDGAAVVLCADRRAEVDAAASELRDERLDVTGVTADVRVSDEVAAAVAAAVMTYGGLDVLVNCAGVQRYGTVETTPQEVWDEVFAINVGGIYQAARHAIPELRRRGGGAIVNVSSVQATASQQGVAAYTASKGAISALTRAMALDHAADGIRVNAVAPGSVDTPMLRWAADRFRGEEPVEQLLDRWGRMHPLGRVAQPAEVAAAIAFLAGPDASFVSGSELRVDGAMLASLPVSLPENER